MSVQAISWVLNSSSSRLAARHVLISIANHCDKYGENAFPSIRTIAFEARLSPRQVQRSIPNLVSSGELNVEVGAGPRGSNLYCLEKMRDDILSSLPHDLRQKMPAGVSNQSIQSDKFGGVIRKNRPEPFHNQIPPSSEAVRLSELLKTFILRNNPSARVMPAHLDQWALIADRMIRLDDRTVAQIEHLIVWSQNDDFWCRNILSMNKLREKFDQLTVNGLRQRHCDMNVEVGEHRLAPPRWAGLGDPDGEKEPRQ